MATCGYLDTAPWCGNPIFPTRGAKLGTSQGTKGASGMEMIFIVGTSSRWDLCLSYWAVTLLKLNKWVRDFKCLFDDSSLFCVEWAVTRMSLFSIAWQSGHTSGGSGGKCPCFICLLRWTWKNNSQKSFCKHIQRKNFQPYSIYIFLR